MSKNLYQKINAVMLEVQTVFKNVTVSGYGAGYKGVSHDDITALLHQPIAKNGIVTNINMLDHVLTEGVTSKGGKIYISNVWASVEFINADNPEERMTSKAFAIGFDSQDKGPGKAYSMAVKYCFLKTFMLESSDDEEQRLAEQIKSLTTLDLVMFEVKKIQKDDAASLKDFMDTKGIGPRDVKALSEDGLKELLKDMKEVFN